MLTCHRCQTENPPQAKFCLECAAPLAARCASCGTRLPASAKFCPECAQPVSGGTDAQHRFASPESYTPKHLAEKILTSKSALEGERKQVTVLFCDIANSTALAERLGPEAMHALLNRFFELALGEVHRYEGTINQFLGDGFMALFGAPLAHEDHARRAVLAALGIQRTLREHRGELSEEEELSLRMGLNTGLVVVGKIGDNLRMDYTAVGDTTNLAARLQQLAQPGEICLSETTYRLVEPYVECEALGEHRVKGKAEPVAVYRLIAVPARPEPGRRESRPIASPLVGRDREVAALSACLERLAAGQGGIVGVLGEAGLGKSRLVTEVSRKAADCGLLWLEGRALSFGRTLSYWPFLEILRRWAGITEEDSEAESQVKLAREVRALIPEEVADGLPYVTTLLGLPVPEALEHRVKYLDGQAMGRQIFRSTRRLFERLATVRPVVLVFEDLHWADGSSAELLEHLFPLTGAVPLLLCGVGRPERESPAARLREVARASHGDRYTEIALAPLSADTSATLLDNLLVRSRASARLRELIFARTEGNPFFVEEVVRSFVTGGTLAWDPVAGEWRLTRDVDQLTIPDTLHGVIAARIDRLDDRVKDVLKVASVIGRSFFYRVLAALADASRALDADLEELQQLELIREKRRIPEIEYFFKHALVQEATYESILTERRRRLHRQVAECIEALFAERLEEFYGLLAYHFARAEEWGKAQGYLFKAGDQAGRVAADAEALAHYRQAITAYERAFGARWDPLQRASLQRKMGEALFRRGEHHQALEYLQRALAYLGVPYPTSRRGVRLAIVRQVVQQLVHRLLPGLFLRGEPPRGDPPAEERSRVYNVLGWIDLFVDPERLLLDVLLQLNMSERSGLPMGVALGSMGVGIICDVIPLFGLASRYHRHAVTEAERVKNPVVMAQAYLGLGFHESYVGNSNKALEHLGRAAAAYKEAGDLRGWAAAGTMILWVGWKREGFASNLEKARGILRVAREGADSQVAAWGLEWLGLLKYSAGPLDEAVAHLQEGIGLLKAVPDYAAAAWACGYLGWCYLHQGKLQQALGVLEAANQLIAERGVRGSWVYSSVTGLAEAYLAVAEQAEGREKSEAMKRAKRACRIVLRHGKSFRHGSPHATRLKGTYQWLTGKPAAARRSWQRSLAVAEELGARYDLGLTYLEMGRRLGRDEDLQRAEAIFAELGAKLDLARTRQLLSACQASCNSPPGPIL